EQLSFDRKYQSYFPLGVMVKRDDKEMSIPLYRLSVNDTLIIRNHELTELESDPFSIGSFYREDRSFTCKQYQLREGDCIYLFSDGYADQFGGPKNKKFMRKQFRNTLLSIYHLPMAEQKWRLAETLDRWKGSQEQVDDILVIGVKVE
ncbi:MAG: SpoIIE family protein phosphatase, partial [Bacteroidota bacterium]